MWHRIYSISNLSLLDRIFLGILSAAVLLTLLSLPFLPEQIPVHFNKNLEPDRYMAKPLGAFVVLALGVLIYLASRPMAWMVGFSAMYPLAVVIRVMHFAIGTILLLLNVAICFGSIVFS